MSDRYAIGHPAPFEMLAEWKGDAILAPGVFREEKQEEEMLASGDVGELAAWLAVTALSREFERGDYPAQKARVMKALTDWRERFGAEKLGEVKQQLLLQVQISAKNAKVSLEELSRRVEVLFQSMDQ